MSSTGEQRRTLSKLRNTYSIFIKQRPEFLQNPMISTCEKWSNTPRKAIAIGKMQLFCFWTPRTSLVLKINEKVHVIIDQYFSLILHASSLCIILCKLCKCTKLSSLTLSKGVTNFELSSKFIRGHLQIAENDQMVKYFFEI